MNPPRLTWNAIGRALLAVVLLGALAGVAGSQLAPQLPLATVLLYSLAGVALLFGLLIALILGQATWSQAILRNGGTDTQWLWFRADPPGLAALRNPTDATSPQEKQTS